MVGGQQCPSKGGRVSLVGPGWVTTVAQKPAEKEAWLEPTLEMLTSNDFFDWLAVFDHVHGPTGGMIELHARVDSQGVKDRREKIAGA
jgi:hypothetical protein